MKKSLLILLLCAASTFTGHALSTKDGFYETNIANYITIELQCEYIKPTKVKNGASRSPMQAPTIGFDGRRLYLMKSNPDVFRQDSVFYYNMTDLTN